MNCKDCLSRRDFLTTAAGAAGLVAISGCGDGFLANPRVLQVLPNGPVVITVADFPGLANAGFLVPIPNTVVAVKRIDATTFKALSMICTHQGCTTRTNGQSFECPCHGSRFSNDGAVINGPVFGGGLATDLPVIDTSYDVATDELTIGS
jgi:cytochrome b6-f complex iron-sulfur subunit